VTAAALLTRLAGLGVCAEAEQGSLRLRPASAIPDDVLAALREHKAEVLALLTAPAALDLGVLPTRPCSECDGRVWWRRSILSGGPSPWHCERCQPPDPDAWRDACVCPVPQVRT
jgi:hypothetical protein